MEKNHTPSRFDPRSRMLPFHVLLVLAIALASLAGKCPPQGPVTPPAVSHVAPFLRGYLAAAAAVKETTVAAFRGLSRDIYLPGAKVFLENASSGTRSSAVQTDLSGRFTVAVSQPGQYKVCWSAPGFDDGCAAKPFAVGNVPVNVGKVRIPLPQRPRATAVFGQVRMADGSLPRMLDVLASINAFATVELLDAGGAVLHRAFVNNFGEYVLPEVPVQTRITLRARMEGGAGDQVLLPQANLQGALAHPINLRIANHPPRVEPVVATDAAGKRVKVALPGATVHLRARASDKDNDPLRFRWQVAGGSGSVSNATAANVTWQLPNHRGQFSVTLTAWDGKGGYAQSTLSLRADPRGVPFSGRVETTTGTAIPAAAVDINGTTAATDSGGRFRVFVPDAATYVLNIRKPGFALVSKIYDDGVTGGRWVMTAATVQTVNPQQFIDVVNRRKPEDCPGRLSERLDWRTYPALLQPQWQDGKGNVILAREKLEGLLPKITDRRRGRECGPGVRVQIPANSLVDANGNPPPGNVQVAVSTVDLMSPEQMPGDYTVALPGGSTRVMQSYGAGTVEVTAGGQSYNLKPGAEATVTIPVDPSQLAAGGSLPSTIPLLFYDERKGVWIEEGEATLQGSAYEAKVKHFSSINTDLVKTDQSCVRVKSPTLPSTYKLEITIPMGGGAAPKVLTVQIDNSSPSEHVVYNLPSNTNIVLVPIRINNNIPIGTFIVNTGGPQVPTDPNRPAGPPYNACSTEVILTEQAVPLPDKATGFLHGLAAFAATNVDVLKEADPNDPLAQEVNAATGEYYNLVDPLDQNGQRRRDTLAKFKAVNNFDGTETRAIYANSGDLGFGREMYCKQTGANVACYVTNYGFGGAGPFDSNDTPDEDDVAEAVSAATGGPGVPVATVAMEYSPIEDDPAGTPVVKFYVYAGDGNSLLRDANLDGLGARPIPQLCMVCHGGNYPASLTFSPNGVPEFNDVTDVKLGSIFIPFDLQLFTFDTTPGFTKTDQQAAFKTLNDMVKATNPTPEVTEVADKMYQANPAVQDENFVVNGWNAANNERVMYRDVVAPACRTCHITNAVPALRFSTRAQATDDATARLGQIEGRVCVEHVMPHALRTHEIFWTSVGPHMPAQLQVFGDAFKTPLNNWVGDKCGVFTPGGQLSEFELLVQPIFAGVNTSGAQSCTNCHAGASPSGGLNLQAAFSHAQLVNVASVQSPLNRVTPNNVSQSYLVHKLEGTHQSAPANGSGGKMPLGCNGGGPCLNATDINVIKTWINNGAPP